MSHKITKVEKDNLRRNSTGKPDLATKGDDLGPHYLRASTGSCHDVCKYGKQHNFETKPWRPWRKRKPMSQDDQHPVEIFVLVDEKNTAIKSDQREQSTAMQSPLPMKSPSHDSSESVKHEVSEPVNHTSLEPSKSIDQDFPSHGESSFSDALELTQQEASSCINSASHDSSESVKHEVSEPVNHTSLEPSKSIDQDFPSHGESSFSDALELTQQEASSCINSASPDALESINQYAVLHVQSSLQNVSESLEGESLSCTRQPSADAAKSMKEEAPVKSILADASKSNKREVPSPAHRRVTPRKPSSDDKETNTSEKASGILKPKRGTVRPTSSLKPSGGSSGKINGDNKIQNNSRNTRIVVKKILSPSAGLLSPKAKRSSKVAGEKVLVPSTALLSPKTSGWKATSSKARTNMSQTNESQKTEASHKRRNWIRKAEPDKVGGAKVPEKTLHVIKVGTDHKSPGSAHNGSRIIRSPSPFSRATLKSSPHPFSHSSSSHERVDLYEFGYTDTDGDECASNGLDLKEGVKLRSRSARKFLSKEEKSAALKLTFKRGKVVEPQSEASSPMRLRFRRGRIWDNKGANGDPRRNSFRRRVAGDNMDGSKAAEKVVLRHQDVQGKKNDQVLLNNVIEETASKLVETRKSKVKALVGAFESVISLQEGKRSAHKPTESIS
ncbi:hypothetical protein Ancab_034238 [Ancistrocladus abbreviatus]